MNWVGGARNRIKKQEEKRKQKEFFARMKQAKRYHPETSDDSMKPAISKDLLFFHTIDRCFGKNILNKKASSAAKAEPSVPHKRPVSDLDEHCGTTIIPDTLRDLSHFQAEGPSIFKPEENSCQTNKYADFRFSPIKTNQKFRRFSGTYPVSEDFQEFHNHPTTYPMDKHSEPFYVSRSSERCQIPAASSKPFELGEEPPETVFATQEALLFSGKRDWPRTRTTVERHESNEPEWRASMFTSKHPETIVSSCAEDLNPADHSASNYIFYDSNDEVQSHDYVDRSSHRSSSLRHHSTWATPLKPEWQKAIRSCNATPRGLEEHQLFRSKPYLDHRSKLFSWGNDKKDEVVKGIPNTPLPQSHEKQAVEMHEDPSFTPSGPNAAGNKWDIYTEDKMHSYPSKEAASTEVVESSPLFHDVPSRDPSAKSDDGQCSDVVGEKDSSLQEVLDLETRETWPDAHEYQKWLIKEICQQLCYFHAENAEKRKHISLQRIAVPSAAGEGSVPVVCSSGKSPIKVVEVCDQGTKMERAEFKDQCLGTEKIVTLNCAVQSCAGLLDKSTQTQEDIVTNTPYNLAPKELVSFGVQTEEMEILVSDRREIDC